MMIRLLSISCLAAAAACLTVVEPKPVAAQGKGVWTDPNDSSLPPDFKYQGEYLGQANGGDKIGCQIIALDKGAFQAVVLPGGLPGDGWNGKDKSLLDGKLEDGKVVFKAATGKKRYLAQPPAEFSATSKFPPQGQKEYSGNCDGQNLVLTTDDGKTFDLKKVSRTSPTLGAKPPEGARALFDGTNTDAWKGGRLDKTTGYLNTDGSDIVSKDKFNNYTLHVEFMLPFKPDGRGQGRGNSGVYQVDMYELQVLDSFGLDGKNNECGGFYTKAAPNVNMCYPPLAWQTYDIDFTNAVAENGKPVKKAVATVKHNGVLIHDQVQLDGPTGGGRGANEIGTPGIIKLQGHGNPLQFRNIWIVEKK